MNTKTLAPRKISIETASRIARSLTAKLGTPEGSSGSIRSRWHVETTWRFRTDDGSAWARLGYGPTRKLVTIARVEGETTATLHVHLCGRN